MLEEHADALQHALEENAEEHTRDLEEHARDLEEHARGLEEHARGLEEHLACIRMLYKSMGHANVLTQLRKAMTCATHTNLK